MTARDWIEKDFYGELGVSSSATSDEIKKAYRKLARENHPDAHPGDTKAENKFKAVSEAYGVLSDPEKRKQYDEARSLFSGGGFRGGSPGGGFGGFGGTNTGGFDIGDLFGGMSGGTAAGGGGGLGDILGGLFGRRGGAGSTGTRPQRGQDVETEINIDFADAVKGATVPLRLSSPATCDTCRGSGAKPGTSPRTCSTCHGNGIVSRNQGAFAFSEPCPDCRGTGSIVDEPCPDCGGAGVRTKTRSITVRIPPGVDDGQRIRLAGQGEPGRNSGNSGDLFVLVHVNGHAVFGRSGNDLTVSVPVTFPELALGTKVTVPTLDSTVTVKVPAGTNSGRTLRVKGKGISRRDGRTGDLLVTLEIAVPGKLDKSAKEALDAYTRATSSHDPREGMWAALGRKGS